MASAFTSVTDVVHRHTIRTDYVKQSQLDLLCNQGTLFYIRLKNVVVKIEKKKRKEKIVLNKNILKIWSWVHRPYFILIVDIELHRFTSKTESLSTVILKPLRVAHLSLQKLRKSSRAADHFFPTKRLVTIVTKNGFFSFHGNRIYPICRKCVLS